MRHRNSVSWWLRGIAVVGALAGVGCGGTTDDRPATWAFIGPAIIEPSCATASCHSDVARRANVNLFDSKTGYDSLVGRRFVIPSHSDVSELMFLLEARGARRMPPDFALPAADIELIRTWIDMGAK